MWINKQMMRYAVLYSYLFKLLYYFFTKLFKTTFQKDTILQKYVKKPTYNFENNKKMEQMSSVCISQWQPTYTVMFTLLLWKPFINQN